MLNPAVRDLYQRVILQHSQAPHGLGPLPEATHVSTLHNALCGDQITLRLRLLAAPPGQMPTIAQVGFEGDSCALCRASASLLCQRLPGQSAPAALALFRALQAFLRPRPAAADARPELTASDDEALLGELVALAGVRDFPSRLRCATLPWEALQAALPDVEAAGQATGDPA